MRLERLRRRPGGLIDRRGQPSRSSGSLPGGFPGGGQGGRGGLGGLPIPVGRGGFGVVALLIVVVAFLVLTQCLGGSSLIPNPGAIDGFPGVTGSGGGTEVPQRPHGRIR